MRRHFPAVTTGERLFDPVHAEPLVGFVPGLDHQAARELRATEGFRALDPFERPTFGPRELPVGENHGISQRVPSGFFRQTVHQVVRVPRRTRYDDLPTLGHTRSDVRLEPVVHLVAGVLRAGVFPVEHVVAEGEIQTRAEDFSANTDGLDRRVTDRVLSFDGDGELGPLLPRAQLREDFPQGIIPTDTRLDVLRDGLQRLFRLIGRQGYERDSLVGVLPQHEH